MNLFECKVRYQKEIGDGKMQNSTDTYLIEAINFGDAETRVLEEVRPFAFAGGDVEMKSIKKVIYSEILPKDDGHYWYKTKLQLTTLDESSGKEKKVNVNLLVQETDMQKAYEAVQHLMKDSVTDYEIINLQQTEIVDVLTLVSNAQRE